MEIPQSVIEAVNCLLKPYGFNANSILNRDNAENDKRYMTAQQASKYCGLSAKTIRDKALAGEIGSIKIGDSSKSRVLIIKSTLDSWLEGCPSGKRQIA